MRLMKTAALLILSGSLFAQDAKLSDKALHQALKDANPKAVATAVAALLSAGTPEAMKILLSSVAKPLVRDARRDRDSADDSSLNECYFTVLGAAASFTEPSALDLLGEFILTHKKEAVGRDALAAACNHSGSGITTLCLRVLEGGSDEFKLMAVDHLAKVAERTTVEPLIRALKQNEKGSGAVLLALGRLLTVLTGQDYADSVTNWTGWWEANKDKDWQAASPAAGGSTGTVTDSLDHARMTEVERLKKSGKILVLGAATGCKCGKDHDLDHIEAVTTQMGLETVKVNKTEFEALDQSQINQYIAILGNCTHIREHCVCPFCTPGDYGGDRLFKCVCPKNLHEAARYVMSEKGCQKIRRYVESGGYLFAEDWCLEDYVQKAFSEYVIIGTVRPKDETVAVFPKTGCSSHPYLENIFRVPAREREKGQTVTDDDLDPIGHSWKIDRETRTVHIRDPRVVTLLTSPELRRTAKGDDAVAITFEVKPDTATGTAAKKSAPVATGAELSRDRKSMSGGRVLYVLSHFGKQESTLDEFSLQNLLLNFLVEANERRGSGKPVR